MNELILTLTEIFATNFVAYYRTHVSHVNIQGRNFYSDHKLLQKIYENLQDQIDTIAEFLRSVESFMPESLNLVLSDSLIADRSVIGTSDELLRSVRDDLQTLVDLYRRLESAAEDAGQDQIANYAQDQETVLTKQIWMLNSTVGETEPDGDYDD